MCNFVPNATRTFLSVCLSVCLVELFTSDEWWWPEQKGACAINLTSAIQSEILSFRVATSFGVHVFMCKFRNTRFDTCTQLLANRKKTNQDLQHLSFFVSRILASHICSLVFPMLPLFPCACPFLVGTLTFTTFSMGSRSDNRVE